MHRVSQTTNARPLTSTPFTCRQTTAFRAASTTPKPVTFEELIAEAKHLIQGVVVYSRAEIHSISPVLTMAGVDSLLPVTSAFNPLPLAPVKFDARGRWSGWAAATEFTTTTLLKKTNRSVFAVQAPTCLPYLADTIVDYSMATFWMPVRWLRPHQPLPSTYFGADTITRVYWAPPDVPTCPVVVGWSARLGARALVEPSSTGDR